jgi:hypothetical protein
VCGFSRGSYLENFRAIRRAIRVKCPIVANHLAFGDMTFCCAICFKGNKIEVAIGLWVH